MMIGCDMMLVMDSITRTATPSGGAVSPLKAALVPPTKYVAHPYQVYRGSAAHMYFITHCVGLEDGGNIDHKEFEIGIQVLHSEGEQ